MRRTEDATDARRQRRNRAKSVVGLLRQEHRDDAVVLDELAARFERRALALGAGSGGAAVVPGIGTAVAVAAATADVAAFAREANDHLVRVAYVRGLDTLDARVAQELRRVVTSTVRNLERHPHRDDAPLARVRRMASSSTAMVGLKQGLRLAARTIPLGGGIVLGSTMNVVLARRVMEQGDVVIDQLLAQRATGRVEWSA